MLVYASMFADELHHAASKGWTIGEAKFDWAALRDFVNSDVDRLEGLYGNTLGNAGVESFAERAVITGPNTLRLARSEEHTSELQSLMRISYAVFCLKKKKQTNIQ